MAKGSTYFELLKYREIYTRVDDKKICRQLEDAHKISEMQSSERDTTTENAVTC